LNRTGGAVWLFAPSQTGTVNVCPWPSFGAVLRRYGALGRNVRSASSLAERVSARQTCNVSMRTKRESPDSLQRQNALAVRTGQQAPAGSVGDGHHLQPEAKWRHRRYLKGSTPGCLTPMGQI